MLKWFGISIVAIYSFLTVGVHLQLHYCCDKLADVSILIESSDNCENKEHAACGLEEQCCSYREMDFRLTEEQKNSSPLRIVAAPQVVSGISEFNSTAQEFSVVSVPFEDVLPPGDIPAYVMNCCLVLYA